MLTVLSEVDADWLYGQLGSSQGRFPKNFVDRVPVGLPRFAKEQKADAKSKTVAESKTAAVSRLTSRVAFALFIFCILFLVFCA